MELVWCANWHHHVPKWAKNRLSRKRSETHRNGSTVTSRPHNSRVDTKTHPSMCGWPLGDNICPFSITWRDGVVISRGPPHKGHPPTLKKKSQTIRHTGQYPLYYRVYPTIGKWNHAPARSTDFCSYSYACRYRSYGYNCKTGGTPCVFGRKSMVKCYWVPFTIGYRF